MSIHTGTNLLCRKLLAAKRTTVLVQQRHLAFTRIRSHRTNVCKDMNTSDCTAQKSFSLVVMTIILHSRFKNTDADNSGTQ